MVLEPIDPRDVHEGDTTMICRRRDDRGQGSLESIGMIVVAALVTGTVVGTVVTQVPAVSSTVCKSLHAITQNGGSCGSPSASAAPTTKAGTTTGTVAKPRSPVCTPSGTQARSNGFPEGSIAVKKKVESPGGITSSNETTIKIGNITVDPNGNEWQTSSVISDTRLTDKGKAALKDVKVDLSVFGGTALTYAITVPPSATGNLTAGIPPNPFDPASIPEGGNVTLTGKTYAGLGLDASYKLLRSSVTSQAGIEVSTAVVKLPGGKVRVLVGPADILENSLKFGFGTNDANIAAYVDDKYTDYKLDQADFDLSTDAGQSAYYAMVLGGAAPRTDGNGVSNRASVEGSKYAHRAGITAQIGALSGKLPGNGRDQDYSVTEFADGRVTYTSKGNEGGIDIVASETVDAKGKLIPASSSYQLRMHDVSAAAVNRFNLLYGHAKTDVKDPQDLVLDFTQADFDAQRAQAYNIIAEGIKNDPDWRDEFNGEPTGDDVKKFIAKMEARHDAAGKSLIDRLGGPGNTQRFEAMQVIKSPNTFANLVYMMRGDVYATSPSNTLNYLNDWQGTLERADITNEDVRGVGNALCRNAG